MQFRDATADSGIRFSHRSPHTADKFLLETMGSGVAAFDYDADGLVDLFFLNAARTVRSGRGVVVNKSDPVTSKYPNGPVPRVAQASSCSIGSSQRSIIIE